MRMRIFSLIFAVFLGLWLAVPERAFAASDEDLQAVHAALRTDEMIRVLSEEGIIDAEDLRDGMFTDRGGTGWQRIVTAIYQPEAMVRRFRAAFNDEMRGADVGPLLAFYRSDVGQRVAKQEVESRRAISADHIEEAARQTYEMLREESDPRLEILDEFVALNDLVERNVAGAMTSNLAFYRGLSDGGGVVMDDQQMLATVWAREGEIRQDTEGWVYAYLTLAYDHLSDDEFRSFTELSASEAGRALNRALFAGFYGAFQDISYELGRAASTFIASEEL